MQRTRLTFRKWREGKRSLQIILNKYVRVFLSTFLLVNLSFYGNLKYHDTQWTIRFVFRKLKKKETIKGYCDKIVPILYYISDVLL